MATVRLISGKWGGRRLSANVSSATHPMSERARSAIFSMLNAKGVLAGAKVLDAFAGTGAIGLEALSRGATAATFIERDRTAQTVLKQNIATVGAEEGSSVICTTVDNWMKNADFTDKHDLIFVDPPYKTPQFSTVWRLLDYLNDNGLMILSYQTAECVKLPNGVAVVEFRSYGGASILILKVNKSL